MYGRRTLAMLAVTCCATGQRKDPKPIKVVPYAGSPVDVLARVVTQRVSARWAEHRDDSPPSRRRHRHRRKLAATADPDGYTLLIGATSRCHSRSIRSDYDPVKSRAGGDAAYSPQVDRTVGAGHHRAGIRDLREANPGQLISVSARHPAADSGRVTQGGHRYQHRQHPLQGGAQASPICSAAASNQFQDHGDAAADPAGQGPGAGGHHPHGARTCPMPTMVESGLPELALTFSAGLPFAPAGTPGHHSQLVRPTKP
jgi:hypothetical protein